MVYERVRGWTSGRSLPVQNFVKYPPGNQPTIESLWKVHWVLEKHWNLLFDCFHLVEELEKTETWTNLAVIP